MLVIRLARVGRTKYPTYRIVAAESARAATGKFVAVLGHYNPHTKELVIKREEVVKHLSNGAQPSNTVTKLLMREKVELPGWVALKTKAPRPVEKPATEEPAAAVKAEAGAPAKGEETNVVADTPDGSSDAAASEAETAEPTA